MNFFTKTSSGAHRSPSYGQWITRFPQYKEWLSDPSRVGLFFIDEGTDHIDMAHEMVAHALHPISTVQGTVFIDLSSLGSMNQESCLTEVLQRILYQLLHLNPEGLWTLYGTLFRSGTIPAKALERFFNPNDNNPKDQDFRMDALLWALPDSTDNLYITFTGLEVIDPDTQIALLDLFLHQVAAFRVRPVKLLFCSKSPQPQSKLPIWAAIIDQEAQRKRESSKLRDDCL
ncbi:hypothetical protein M501DRAFT_685896 [Patellaria atrata CBS 101060]|uniref:Uncharacterized protein n=1 Tax=Patellaria atrata CBS 101060 TaxID=1346257 RepID=A0A9P4SCW9_9PEZI|nr:hypothetical protein M501DRAFT_685896 [Patellaria atrata CBS 101060]